MQVTINADEKTIPDNMNVAELVDFLELQNKRLAIEINRELVPRSTFSKHVIQANDEIEIVHAIGGG